ncbi:MAG: tRNA (adenosine(37)-N6)-threonylcarbamoyltransferase complex ATPase subunit type 1 TsaE [Candidatus Colwellbacteria bacterium]|nr:tRNA (adenosine(37)-N6)-threonylcarbamoyltransferase complex ATPase subunit type 1 TsaE [Candidatus Colwellbacteria bacterium]
MISKSAKETGSIAKNIAAEITNKEKPVILALSGDLGAGKTTFTQSFAKALGVKKRILSPTFLIMKRFPIAQNNFKNLYHIDAYRVRAADLEKLGIQEIFKGQNIVLIEWADRVKEILPKSAIWIKFEHGRQENERQITINRR